MPWITGLRSSVYLRRTRSVRPTRGLDGVVLDVALLAQDARDLRLERRGGHLDLVAVGVRPLRMRVRKSATGSVIDMATSSTSSCRGSCPRADLAHADAAEPELARTRAGGRTACSGCSSGSCTWTRAVGGPRWEVFAICLLSDSSTLSTSGPPPRPRPRAGWAPRSLGVLLLELLVCRRLGLRLQACLLLALLLGLPPRPRPRCRAPSGERHAQLAQAHVGLLVGLRRRRDRRPRTWSIVVVDLEEDDLLADAHRVVPRPSNERALRPRKSRMRGIAIEVRRSRNSYMRAGAGDAHADGHAVTQLEGGDRLARAAHARRLARDRGELLLRPPRARSSPAWPRPRPC